LRTKNASALAPGNTGTPLQQETRRGGVHGCTPFSDLATDGESENPLDKDTSIESFEKAFSLVRFFCALQKK
jgi:hypothetical protein